MTMFLVSAFILAAGTIFLVYPLQLRDWSLRVGQIPQSSWHYRLMFSRGYVFSFRLVGAGWIVFGAIMMMAW
jgi:hypothetical protein